MYRTQWIFGPKYFINIFIYFIKKVSMDKTHLGFWVQLLKKKNASFTWVFTVYPIIKKSLYPSVNGMFNKIQTKFR